MMFFLQLSATDEKNHILYEEDSKHKHETLGSKYFALS